MAQSHFLLEVLLNLFAFIRGHSRFRSAFHRCFQSCRRADLYEGVAQQFNAGHDVPEARLFQKAKLLRRYFIVVRP